MNIKMVDDKPMVIHTKEKAKFHTHETKNSSIKGANVYTSERGTKLMDDRENIDVLSLCSLTFYLLLEKWLWKN